MKKPPLKKPRARDATGVIEWSSLSSIEKEAFLTAYNKESALDARCANCFASEDSIQTTIASFLEVYEGAWAGVAECLELEHAEPNTEELRLKSRVNRQTFEMMAGLARHQIQTLVWLSIKEHDFETLEWLAGHVRNQKTCKKALVHKPKEQDFQKLEIVLSSNLSAVILKQFLELSGVESTYILTSKIAQPQRLPTKAYLKAKVRSAWEEAGHKAKEIDSDFSEYCSAMGLDGLPASSRNPAWQAKV